MKLLENIMKSNEFLMNELSSRVYIGYAFLIAYVFDNKERQDFFYRRYLYDLQERDLNFYLDITNIKESTILNKEAFINLNEYLEEVLIKYPIYWNELIEGIIELSNSRRINWDYVINKVIDTHKVIETNEYNLPNF